MSNEALTWAAKLHPGRGAKAVLMCLADRATDHAGEDWTCFPSIERIMEWTDDSRSSVERHLKKLVAEGFITRRRRRMADGKLGIYDYTLHRDPARRAALKASRAGAEEGSDEAGPDVNLTYGPHVNLTETTRQSDAWRPSQPYVNLTGQEPSIEPSIEPSPGARAGAERRADEVEDGVRRLRALEAAAPPAVLRFYDPVLALEGLGELVAEGVDLDALPAALARMAGHPAFKSRKHPPQLHDWLRKRQFLGWLGDGEAKGAGAVATVGWSGPPEVRAAVAEADGERFAQAYLDRAEWREPRTIVAATGVAFDRLSAAKGLAGSGISIAKKGSER